MIRSVVYWYCSTYFSRVKQWPWRTIQCKVIPKNHRSATPVMFMKQGSLFIEGRLATLGPRQNLQTTKRRTSQWRSFVTREPLDLDAGDDEVVEGEPAGPGVEPGQQVLDEGRREAVAHLGEGWNIDKVSLRAVRVLKKHESKINSNYQRDQGLKKAYQLQLRGILS